MRTAVVLLVSGMFGLLAAGCASPNEEDAGSDEGAVTYTQGEEVVYKGERCQSVVQENGYVAITCYDDAFNPRRQCTAGYLQPSKRAQFFVATYEDSVSGSWTKRVQSNYFKDERSVASLSAFTSYARNMLAAKCGSSLDRPDIITYFDKEDVTLTDPAKKGRPFAGCHWQKRAFGAGAGVSMSSLECFSPRADTQCRYEWNMSTNKVSRTKYSYRAVTGGTDQAQNIDEQVDAPAAMTAAKSAEAAADLATAAAAYAWLATSCTEAQ